MSGALIAGGARSGPGGPVTGGRVLGDDRRTEIMRELTLRGSLSVKDFSSRLGISAMTVRRDLLTLEQKGMLERVHGGALPRRTSSSGRDRTPLVTIALLVPSSGYYYPAVIAGAKAAAAEVGARLILGVTDYSAEIERQQIKRLLDRGVDGIVVAPADTYADDPATYRALADSALPAIVLERSLRTASTDVTLGSVRTDHAHGARLAVQHLVDTGRRRIALCVRAGPTAEALREGYRQALRALLPDVQPIECEIARIEQPATAQQDSLMRVIDRCVKESIDGLIVLPDDAAIAIVDLAIDRGIVVPGDLGIVAYDDEVASLASIPLSAVTPPKRDAGYLSVKACFERIVHRSRRQQEPVGARVDLLPTLTIRESSRLSPDG